MGKILSIIAALFMAVTTVTVAKAGDLSEILADGVVKIAVPESFAPFGSVGATGEHEGYDVDVVHIDIIAFVLASCANRTKRSE